MLKWLNLLAGGVAGTAARYALAGAVYDRLGATFPYGTLIVNLLGCFVIGILSVLAEEKFLLSPEARVLLMAGFCGAFTTFSTFMLETANLIRGGDSPRALANVAASVGGGFLVFRAGVLLAELF